MCLQGEVGHCTVAAGVYSHKGLPGEGGELSATSRETPAVDSADGKILLTLSF